ncbi:MAG: dihydroorotate dehydrogenase [Candidatus Kryptoniota bacterium]
MADNLVNLAVQIGNLKLKNPVMTSSGTAGYGDELSDYFNVTALGAVVTKSLTLKPKVGNAPPRIAEVNGGMLNSIGLANIGIQKFLHEKLPILVKLGATVVVNVAAKRMEDYVTLAELLDDQEGVQGIELNLSCPNVSEGGIEFGSNLKTLRRIVNQVRRVCKKTLIIKLTPNVTGIGEFALAAENEGADAVTIANTYIGMAVNIFTRKSKLHNVTGGLSGPSIKPMTLAKVFEARNAVRIPIVASGGIINWADAIEYILAGATAVQLGTVLFTKPDSPLDVINGIRQYCTGMGIKSVSELIGKVEADISLIPHMKR